MNSIIAPEKLIKQPSEIRKYSMDFSALLASDELIDSIYSIAAAAQDSSITDDLVISDEEIDGSSIIFWVSGGTANQRYKITIIVSVDSGQRLEGDGILYIKDS